MPTNANLTDAERGIAERTTANPSASVTEAQPAPAGPPLSDAARVVEENERRWLSRAKQRIAELESGNAKPGWRLASVAIDDVYYHFEGADPKAYDPFALSVGAVVTFERIDKDLEGGINYGWSRVDYVLGDLLRPEQPKERRSPVKTTKTIRWRNGEIARELKRELDKEAERQLHGKGEDESSKERIRELTQELRENTDELIKRAKTEDDFSEAVSNVATTQAFGESDPGQLRNVAEKYEKEREWVEEAADKRPDSIVNKMRHVRNEATEQMLGVDDEGAPVTRRWELSESDKATIRENARRIAKDRAPRGFRVSQVEVEFIDLRGETSLTPGSALIEVEIEASYDGGIDEKGLPVRHKESWTDNPVHLLKYADPNRRPIEKIPFQY